MVKVAGWLPSIHTMTTGALACKLFLVLIFVTAEAVLPKLFAFVLYKIFACMTLFAGDFLMLSFKTVSGFIMVKIDDMLPAIHRMTRRTLI